MFCSYEVLSFKEKFTCNSNMYFNFYLGWEQPDWYALPGEKVEYKPSFYRYNIRPNANISNIMGYINIWHTSICPNEICYRIISSISTFFHQNQNAQNVCVVFNMVKINLKSYLFCCTYIGSHFEKINSWPGIFRKSSIPPKLIFKWHLFLMCCPLCAQFAWKGLLTLRNAGIENIDI
jgi:hypothetical protein